MKYILQLASRLEELAKACHQRGNRNIDSGFIRIRSAWHPDHSATPKPTR